MAKSNKTKYALLGLLNLRPASGYDLKKTVDGSIGFFWNENYGHIYPILKRMETEGLIKKHVKESDDHPVKNVYALTARGKKEFLKWLGETVEELPLRNEMLLKLFFGTHMNRESVIAMLNSQKEKNENLVKIYGEIKGKISPQKSHDALYWNLTLNFGMQRSKMIISWCNETLKALGRKN